MKNEYNIGIDIGGTNTDAVLIDESHKIAAKVKTPTAELPEEGLKKAVEELCLQKKPFDKESVKEIFIGTTHATNAVIEHKGLYRVGVLRIAGHQPDILKSCAFWPAGLSRNVLARSCVINGGYECDGRQITPFDRSEAKSAIQKLVEGGAESIAVAGVFSPIFPEQELECKSIVEEIFGGGFPITLSHQIGGAGFIERENAAILNSALKKAIRMGFQNIKRVLHQIGFACPLWIAQNDGSTLELEKAMEFPLLTISSGPTNSFVGASKLAGLEDAIIVDIGGTSTDIGMVRRGYPKHSLHNVNIGGVALNFRMPDVAAFAIGGGSYVRAEGDRTTIGPQSCGKDLFTCSQAFGGSSLTLTDAAYAAGVLDIPEARPVSLAYSQAQSVLDQAIGKIKEGIRSMQGQHQGVPIVAVGGGAPLMRFFPQAIIPENYGVANAYGAALAEISCTYETVAMLKDRDALLTDMKEKTLQMAVDRGADPRSVKVVDMVITPYHYMPNHLARVSLKASGKRRTSRGR